MTTLDDQQTITQQAKEERRNTWNVFLAVGVGKYRVLKRLEIVIAKNEVEAYTNAKANHEFYWKSQPVFGFSEIMRTYAETN